MVDRFLKYIPMSIWISSVSVLNVPFLSLILLNWIFSLYILMNLAKDFSIFLIFSKNQLYISLTLCNFFVSILSILALFDYFLLAPLFGSYSFCFRVFSCAQSFRYMISPVFYEGIFMKHILLLWSCILKLLSLYSTHWVCCVCIFISIFIFLSFLNSVFTNFSFNLHECENFLLL